MKAKSKIPKENTKKSKDIAKGVAMRFAQIIFFLVLQAVVMFLASGRFDWIWAWVFLGICIVSILINVAFLSRISPETIAERGRPNWTKKWDIIVAALYSIALFF